MRLGQTVPGKQAWHLPWMGHRFASTAFQRPMLCKERHAISAPRQRPHIKQTSSSELTGKGLGAGGLPLRKIERPIPKPREGRESVRWLGWSYWKQDLGSSLVQRQMGTWRPRVLHHRAWPQGLQLGKYQAYVTKHPLWPRKNYSRGSENLWLWTM